MRRGQRSPFRSLSTGLLLLALTTTALADGTETLGPPSIAVSTGADVAVFGVGMVGTTAAAMSYAIPDDCIVQQALVYWSGEFVDPGSFGDDTIRINGIDVQGALIGGPTNFFRDVYTCSYRADISGLGLVEPGVSALSVDGMDFDFSNHGCGLMVVYQDATAALAEIQLRDGSDCAYRDFGPPLNTTVPQTFVLQPESQDRTVDLCLFAGSVGNGRPNLVEVTVDGVLTQFPNALSSNMGDLWDCVSLPVFVPTGATTVTVQLLSEDPGPLAGFDVPPASLTWVAAALSAPQFAQGEGCTRTQGYWKTHSAYGPAGPADPAWDLLASGADTPFFDTGTSWIAMFWMPPRGSVYPILAHQYEAAVLNGLAGADTTMVQGEISQAQALLDMYDGNPLPPSAIDKDTARTFVNLAVRLDSYNNGWIGPGSCDSSPALLFR